MSVDAKIATLSICGTSTAISRDGWVPFVGRAESIASGSGASGAAGEKTGLVALNVGMDRGQRVLGIDYGRRRIGLAISDVTGTLARPLTTLVVTPEDAVARVGDVVRRLAQEEDGLAAIVVGVPTSLDGNPTDQTSRVIAFIDALGSQTTVPIVRGDDRLTSREAESRLALRERSWRRRKERLDAAAAAVMLQDYLDVEARKDGRAGHEG